MLTLIRETNVDYTKLIVSTIGDVLGDAEDHGMKPTPAMKRLAAYGLLVEAQLDEANTLGEKPQEDMPEKFHFTPDGIEMSFDFTPEWVKQPKVKRKNGRKNCKECNTKLTGLKRLFCSRLCQKRNWIKDNPEKVQASHNRYGKRQKSNQKLSLVK